MSALEHSIFPLLISFTVTLLLFTAAFIMFGLFCTILGATTPSNRRRWLRTTKTKTKPRKHWWQLWRKKPFPDEEMCLPESSALQHAVRVNNYGTIDAFAGFDGTHLTSSLALLSQNDVPFQLVWMINQPPPTQARSLVSFISPLGTQLSSTVSSPTYSSHASMVLANVKVMADVMSFSEHYDLIRTLAYSSEGPIHLVTHRETSERYVIKQLPVKTINGQMQLPDEVRAVRHDLLIPHPNIIRVVDLLYVQTGSQQIANVITEYCDAGDVGNLIHTTYDSSKQIPRHIILHIISSMIDALAFMHFGDVAFDPDTDTLATIGGRQLPIIHRDIKPMNIFMRWSPESKYGMPDVKLADFGFSEPEISTTGTPGTRGFRAPEMVAADQRYGRDVGKMKVCSKASDMYALGVTIYLLLTCESSMPIFPSLEAAFWNSTVSDTPEILIMMKALLSRDPCRRPEINQFHLMSSLFKQEIKQWYEQGGRLDPNTWPDPFSLDTQIGQHNSQQSSSFPDLPLSLPPWQTTSSLLSSTATGEQSITLHIPPAHSSTIICPVPRRLHEPTPSLFQHTNSAIISHGVSERDIITAAEGTILERTHGEGEPQSALPWDNEGKPF